MCRLFDLRHVLENTEKIILPNGTQFIYVFINHNSTTLTRISETTVGFLHLHETVEVVIFSLQFVCVCMCVRVVCVCVCVCVCLSVCWHA